MLDVSAKHGISKDACFSESLFVDEDPVVSSEIEKLILESMSDFMYSSAAEKPPVEAQVLEETAKFQRLDKLDRPADPEASVEGNWEPFKAADLILQDVLSSNSDALFSLMSSDNREGVPFQPNSYQIQSSPNRNSLASEDWVPKTPFSACMHSNRNALSSPATVSFSIKSGRIVPKTFDEKDGTGATKIFKTPSSKRRLDFLSVTGTPDMASKKASSKLVIGNGGEGMIIVPSSDKENVAPKSPFHPESGGRKSSLAVKSLSSASYLNPLGISDILNATSASTTVNTTVPSRSSSFTGSAKVQTSTNNQYLNTVAAGNTMNILSGNGSIHSMLKDKNTDPAGSNINANVIIDNLKSRSSDEEEEEEDGEGDGVNPEYEKFLKGIFGPLPNLEDEDDPDDCIYHEPETLSSRSSLTSRPIKFKRFLKSFTKTDNRRIHYRIKERELNGLIADCRQIISADSINSPFKKLEFQSEQNASTSTTSISSSTKLTVVEKIALLLKIHVQLLFQQFILCASFPGNQEASALAKTVYSMLSELKMQSDLSLAVMGRQLLSAAKEDTIRTSLFVIPTLDKLSILRPLLDRLNLFSSDAPAEPAVKTVRDLPFAMKMLFRFMDSLFTDDWKPVPFKPGICSR